jgi:hypothetical protein
MQMTVLWMGYIVSERPFKDPWNNSQDFMNEMFYYISLDVSFSFTTINSDEVSAITIGSVLNVIIISMLSLNC